MKTLLTALLSILMIAESIAQQVPAVEANIPYMVTFGRKAAQSCGDDDFSQTWFFVIPKSQTKPVYIRIYDPETGGGVDEKNGVFNTKTQFSVYGGKSCFTAKDARANLPTGNYKSGNLLHTKTFGSSGIYDGDWYTFGPFNPTEGELANEYGGYIFKMIAEGIEGDDGNLYKYFLSESPMENKAIEGGNAFTFEYTFRLSDNTKNVTHIYPFIEDHVVLVKISNFDFDNDGDVNIVSIMKTQERSKSSGDNVWASSSHKVTAKEKNTILDVQFIKSPTLIKNNTVTLYVSNQLGGLLPIYTIPIGGISGSKNKTPVNQKKKTTP